MPAMLHDILLQCTGDIEADTLTVKSLLTATTETAKHHILAIDEAN